MNINIYTDSNNLLKSNVYLYTNDYLELFKNSSFGKLLILYKELGKIISEDENRLREWTADEPYTSVANITNKVASIINYEDIPDKEVFDIYPLTIVNDRYNGTYSGGKYTAWKLYPWGIPEAVFGDDNSCWNYFKSTHDIYGCGATPDEAIANLAERLKGNVDDE